jgi:NitT/TauT family transport system substrate-binding protein
MPIGQSRRRFLGQLGIAGVGGMGGLASAGLGGGTRSFAAEPPPEITTIRFEKDPGTCIAPQAAEELLRAEGFTDIRYVDLTETRVRRAAASGANFVVDMIDHDEVDSGRAFAPGLVIGMGAGAPVTVLAGLHTGCFEIFGKENIRRIADLKGTTIGVSGGGNGDEELLKIMIKSVGLDPAKDIRWVASASVEPMHLFIAEKIDAFLAVPPQLQEVRARNIGHVIASSITDRPWSQYYCCMLATHTEFVRKYPIATKRVLRAILKAADLCVSEPQLIARLLVERGYTTRYDYSLKMLNELRYDVWRDFDAEDTVRFYALRLQEAGIIKSSPQKLIAEHTDWRFLNELKRELKT